MICPSVSYSFIKFHTILFKCITEKPPARSAGKREPLQVVVSSSEDSEESELNAPTQAVSLKDKTMDVDAFFHPSQNVGGKPRRACILCKYV